jgi:hypothetical protein
MAAVKRVHAPIGACRAGEGLETVRLEKVPIRMLSIIIYGDDGERE